MLLVPGAAFDLRPLEDQPDSGPFHELLAAWISVGFDKEHCQKIFSKYRKKYKIPEGSSFTPDLFEANRPLASDKYIECKVLKEWMLTCTYDCHRVSKRQVGNVLSQSEAKEVGRLIGEIVSIDDISVLKKKMSFFNTKQFNHFFSTQQVTEDAFPIWPQKTSPGIYRREHASIMISSGKTQILFDPVFFASIGTPPSVPWLRPRLTGGDPPDAVFVSHSHLDHWNLPSLLASTSQSRCKVYVPCPQPPSYLCTDFSGPLNVLGIPNRALKWGETVKVGDIEVDILPFYGEQPAATSMPLDPKIRNWGNCFRVNTPQFSVFVLIDSGKDPWGNMADVVNNSVKKRGPADAVLACMREFLSPFEIPGLATYAMSLSFSQLQHLYSTYKRGKLESCTAGLSADDGLASICGLAKTKCFLPYAQGYAGMGRVIPASEWGPDAGSEKKAMAILAQQFRKHKVKSKAQAWNPGDRIIFSRNESIRFPFSI